MKDMAKSLRGLFRKRSGKERTFRMARDFCVIQSVLAVISVYCSVSGWATLAALCILAQFFEWRFFSLSLRMRRQEEDREDRLAALDKKSRA